MVHIFESLYYIWYYITNIIKYTDMEKQPYDIQAYEAIKKLEQAEQWVDITTQIRLWISKLNIDLSDDVSDSFKKLSRLMKNHSKDVELKQAYNDIVQFIHWRNWEENYYEEWKTLNTYLEQLNNYLQQRYPIEQELEQSLEMITKQSTKEIESLSNDLSISSFQYKEIKQRLLNETWYSLEQISDILSTSSGREILAASLNMSASALEEYFSSGKKIEIIADLIQAKKIWFVIAQIVDNA